MSPSPRAWRPSPPPRTKTIASQKATIDDLTAKLAAAQAGDPSVITALDNVTAGLTAVAPAPADPAAPADQNAAAAEAEQPTA